MNDTKEKPPLGCNPEEAEGTKLSSRAVCVESYDRELAFGLQAVFNDRGTRLVGYKTQNKGQPEHLVKPEEGYITTWSSKSRQRLRELQSEFRAPQGWENHNFTATIPGDVLPVEVSKELWERFTHNMRRHEIIIIWRAEVQKRGQMHWHCCVSANPLTVKVELLLRETWISLIDSLGPVENYKCKSGAVVVLASSRMGIPMADKKVVHLVKETDEGMFWQYLCDHMSKRKQEQIGKNIGRHWGVVGRKYLVRAKQGDRISFTRNEDKLYRRLLQKLCTPFRKVKGAFCGRKRGYRPKYSDFGETVRFGHSVEAHRLALWVKAQGLPLHYERGRHGHPRGVRKQRGAGGTPPDRVFP